MKSTVHSSVAKVLPLPTSRSERSWIKSFFSQLSKGCYEIFHAESPDNVIALSSNEGDAHIEAEKEFTPESEPKSAPCDVTICNEDEKAFWVEAFESEMMIDPTAAPSILGFYLTEVTGDPCSLYSPLGYAPYEQMGKRIAESETVRSAAKIAGLFSTSIPNFVECALDSENTWSYMISGVEELLEDPELRCFVPFRSRYLAEGLCRKYDPQDYDRDQWCDIYTDLCASFRDLYQGY